MRLDAFLAEEGALGWMRMSYREGGLLHAQLHYGRISGILEHGLHEWLEDFMDRIYLLGNGISKDFLVPMDEAA